MGAQKRTVCNVPFLLCLRRCSRRELANAGEQRLGDSFSRKNPLREGRSPKFLRARGLRQSNKTKGGSGPEQLLESHSAKSVGHERAESSRGHRRKQAVTCEAGRHNAGTLKDGVRCRDTQTCRFPSKARLLR